jgi:hypothetical protein
MFYILRWREHALFDKLSVRMMYLRQKNVSAATLLQSSVPR